MKLHPWIAPYWVKLWSSYTENGHHAPHAWMISGPHGGGKLQLPLALAQHLLCEHLTHCQTCKGCHLLSAGNHPDFIHIAPEEAGKALRIQVIRTLIQQLEHTPHQGGWRVVLIEDADALNSSAANALLKTLEEPPPNTVLVLLVAQTHRLPATILSRCQHLFVPLPSQKASTEWLLAQHYDGAAIEQALTVSDGAPLIAKTLLDDQSLAVWQDWSESLKRFLSSKVALSELVKQWQEWDEQAIKWLYQWVQHQLKQPHKINSTSAHEYYQQLLFVHQHWRHHLNKHVILQQLLMDLKQEFSYQP